MLGTAHAGHDAEFTVRTVDRLSGRAADRLAHLVSEPAGDAVGGGAGFLAELKPDPGRCWSRSRRPSVSNGADLYV